MYPLFFECGDCNLVIPADLNLLKVGTPAPCCGGESARILWPSYGFEEYAEALEGIDISTPAGLRMGIIFACTATELLLELTLRRMLRPLHGASSELTDFILDSVTGVERRIAFYNALSDQPLGTLLKQSGLEAFTSRWATLRKLRNNLVHGSYHAVADDKEELLENILFEGLRVFAVVHNDVQRQVRNKRRVNS